MTNRGDRIFLRILFLFGMAIVWYSWLDPLIPAAETYHEKTIFEDSNGNTTQPFKRGQTIYVCGEGKRLRKYCSPKFHRTLETPDGKVFELAGGSGIPSRNDGGLRCTGIAISDDSRIGTYYFYSTGTWSCGTGHPQTIKGWHGTFVINE